MLFLFPLYINTGRPSSRSSQRSSGSISSYSNRRASGVPYNGSKGVLVSSSRTGAARSAAILLVSRHISDNSNTNPVYGSKYNQNMRQYLQRQLEQQKELLFLDIPSLRNQKNFLSKLTSSQYSKCKSDENGMCNVVGNNSKSNTSCHGYENSLNTRDTRDGSSSFDDLDDWDDCSSVEKFEFGALPTPASEQANFAVISQKCQLFCVPSLFVLFYSHFPFLLSFFWFGFFITFPFQVWFVLCTDLSSYIYLILTFYTLYCAFSVLRHVSTLCTNCLSGIFPGFKLNVFIITKKKG